MPNEPNIKEIVAELEAHAKQAIEDRRLVEQIAPRDLLDFIADWRKRGEAREPTPRTSLEHLGVNRGFLKPWAREKVNEINDIQGAPRTKENKRSKEVPL